MNLIISNLIFALVSLVLFFFAPQNFSYGFCASVAVFFVAQNVLYFIFDERKNILGFEFFFALSFGITNFIYPIIYYPTTEGGLWIFELPYNHAIISKATAIAYVGYTFFMLGITKLVRLDRERPEKPDFRFNMNQFLLFFIITVVSFALYLGFGGWKAIQNVYSGSGDIREVGIYSYFNNLFSIACYLMAIFVFKLDKQKTAFYLIVLFFCMFVILASGSRALVLGLGLIIVVGFNNHVKKFSLLQVTLITLFGVLLMFFVVKVRSIRFDAEQWMNILANLKVSNFFDIFSDLVMNNRNLYVLMDYGDTHNLTFFHGMLTDIFSPIPGMTGKLVQWTNCPIELISGGTLPTYLAFGADSSFGLGTNMVGEAYRSFALLGVLFFCFAIGYVIKAAFFASRYNIYAYVLYYLFVSHAVMFPRAPILFNLRTVVWSLLLVFIVRFVTRPERPEQLGKIKK